MSAAYVRPRHFAWADSSTRSTIDASTLGLIAVVYTFLPHAEAIGLSSRPDGFNDAAAIVKDSVGTLQNVGTCVSFN